MSGKRFLAAVGAAVAAVGAAAQVQPKVTANDLKADVSFLASDALEGRGTPSKGLDIAAEYIAAEFRRAGLEPAGDDGYFQTANFESVKPNTEGLELTLTIGGKKIKVDPGAVLLRQQSAATLSEAEVVRVSGSDLASLPADKIRGKALVVEGSARINAAANAALLVIVIANQAPAAGPARAALRDASAAPAATRSAYRASPTYTAPPSPSSGSRASSCPSSTCRRAPSCSPPNAGPARPCRPA